MTRVADAAQLAYATARDWITITHNGRHFRSLHRAMRERGEAHGGIIVLPEKPPFLRLVLRAAMSLTWIATVRDSRSSLFTWGQLQERFEAGERLPGFTDDEVRLALGRS